MSTGDIERKFGFLSNRLRLARERAVVSQQELADRIGRSLEDVVAIEGGQLKDELGTVYLICNELGLNFKDLFNQEPEENVVVPFPGKVRLK